MPPMPYTMEVGPVFSLLNSYVEDQINMVTLLEELRDPTTTLGNLKVFQSPSTRNLPGNSPIGHIEQQWFGFTPGTQNQPGFVASNPAPTGWWKGWYGDAAAITRETLRRGLEVALGVANDAPTVEPTRCWRLQFAWTCATPFFQGWVNWQDGTGGYVTVTFTTPGNGHRLYATPHRPARTPGSPNDYEDPAWTVSDYGLWIIGENDTEVLESRRVRSSKGGEFTWQHAGQRFLPDWPGFVHTYGGVCVVAPAEIDGGVLRAGRPW